MFEDKNNGHTCYCEECLIKQEKIEQLKAENDELKKLKDDILNKKPSEREYCKGCTLPTYSKVLNEIEKICTHEIINLTDSCVNGGRYFEILQKINEVKGNE